MAAAEPGSGGGGEGGGGERSSRSHFRSSSLISAGGALPRRRHRARSSCRQVMSGKHAKGCAFAVDEAAMSPPPPAAGPAEGRVDSTQACSVSRSLKP